MIYKDKTEFRFCFRDNLIIILTTMESLVDVWWMFGTIIKKSCSYKAVVLEHSSEVVVALRRSETFNSSRGKLVKCLVLWWENISHYIKTSSVTPNTLNTN